LGIQNNQNGSVAMINELWTVEDLATKWRLKPSWIYQHIAELPHLKLGNLVRFVPEELERYLARSRKGPDKGTAK
jgi:hypothetical protein